VKVSENDHDLNPPVVRLHHFSWIEYTIKDVSERRHKCGIGSEMNEHSKPMKLNRGSPEHRDQKMGEMGIEISVKKKVWSTKKQNSRSKGNLFGLRKNGLIVINIDSCD
jgi:hypothetical protein